MDQLVAGDTAGADATQQRVDAINAVYQKGRTISELFGALKAIMELFGLCGRHVFSPLLPATDEEVEQIRRGLVQLGLMR
jgi:dihydrodipicolinate synthase/N-acetylneuraminate lyase